jgi:tetratricopeptide (TPR) repeat protein
MLFGPLRCLALLALLSAVAYAQKPSTDNEGPGPNQDPPRSSAAAHEAGDSSSRDTIIDLSPPRNDAKDHPNSASATDDYDQTQEFHPYDPHKADKNVEVGDYYYKRQNYRAAESRYHEALYYKPDDAIATFRLAQAEEKLGKDEEAIASYAAYLKILPHGPDASESNKAIARLKAKLAQEDAKEQLAPSAKNQPSAQK